MPPFVLVHGSNGGGRVWKKLTPAALVDWINARATPHPVSTYTEAVPRGSARGSALSPVFIHCTGSRSTTPDVFGPFADRVRDQGWTVYEIAAGHLAMLTAPDELAGLLLEVAAHA